TGPPSGFNTSPRLSKRCQPIRPAAAMSVTPPIRMYRARRGIPSRPAGDQDQKPLTEGIVIVLAEGGLLGAYYCRTRGSFFQIRSRIDPGQQGRNQLWPKPKEWRS